MSLKYIGQHVGVKHASSIQSARGSNVMSKISVGRRVRPVEIIAFLSYGTSYSWFGSQKFPHAPFVLTGDGRTDGIGQRTINKSPLLKRTELASLVRVHGTTKKTIGDHVGVLAKELPGLLETAHSRSFGERRVKYTLFVISTPSLCCAHRNVR